MVVVVGIAVLEAVVVITLAVEVVVVVIVEVFAAVVVAIEATTVVESMVVVVDVMGTAGFLEVVVPLIYSLMYDEACPL